MAAHFLPVLLLSITTRTFGDSVTDGTNLVSTFLIHRHGDRTPIEASIRYSTNVEELRAASAPYGYGQLTTLGMQRAYTLGEYIRARYDELLSDKYNSSEIYIRSTDSTRTKMTVLLAMAAVFPSYSGSWSEEINWVPTPYTTAPVRYDFNMAFLNCPEYTSDFKSLLRSSNSPRMCPHIEVLNVMTEQLGYNVTNMPNTVHGIYDVLISQAVYLPSPGEDLVYLPVDGCDSLLCPYDTFKEIASPYALDEESWRTKCGYTDDLVIDDLQLAQIY